MEQDVFGAHSFGWHSIAVAPELGALAARLELRRRIPWRNPGFGVADSLAYLCGAARCDGAFLRTTGSAEEACAAVPAAVGATYAFPSESGGAAAETVDCKEAAAQPRSPLSLAATRMMTHASLCVPSVQYLADVHGAAGAVALLYDCARSKVR
jgi:hypothetical protein